MSRIVFLAFVITLFSCGEDQPYLSGFVKTPYDAILSPCDPYGKGQTHTCLIFSSANQGHLYFFDASDREFVLGPTARRPLMVKVGPNTNPLVSVVDGGKKSPWIFALDRSEPSIYAVRMFPSEDGKHKSLINQSPQSLSKKPKKMAAVLFKDKIIAIFTLPEEQSIWVMAIDKNTGQIDRSIGDKTFKVGSKPSQLNIIAGQVVVSDEGENNLHVLKVDEIFELLTKGTVPTVRDIDIKMASDKLSLAQKDLGHGLKTYALAIEAFGQKVALVNIDAQAEPVEASIVADVYPMAAYFPDQESLKFKNAKNWLSLVSVKGSLEHYSIEPASKGLELKKINTIDLLSDDHLDLSTMHLTKILGGTIEPGAKHEKTCQKGRQVYYITSSAYSKSYYDADSFVVEAFAFACEDEQGASRLSSGSNTIPKRSDDRSYHNL